MQPSSGIETQPVSDRRPHDASPVSRFALVCLAVGLLAGLLAGCGTSKRLGRFLAGDPHAERAVHAAANAFPLIPAAPLGAH